MNGEQIVRTYSDLVYGIAMRYARDPTDADDIYNETFYRYFRRERTFSEEEHRKSWLIRVAVNCAKDFLMKKNHDAELSEDMFGEVTITGSDVSQEELTDLRNALKRLPEEYREVIELYYLNGINTREIAMMLQRPQRQIIYQMDKGKEKLKEMLTQGGG